MERLEGANPETAALAAHLAAIFGPAAVAILHYGSRAQGRGTRADSAFDFFIVVRSYREAYHAAAATTGVSRRRLAILLSRLLPPNAMAVRWPGPFGEREAKTLIFSERIFRRESSPRARDQFVHTRMTQRVRLAWSRDDASAEVIERCVEAARRHAFAWLGPFLPRHFSLADYCRALIEVSLAHEVRAEAKGHAELLLGAQGEALAAIHGPMLARLVERGVLLKDDGGYRQRHPPSFFARLRVRTYLQWSKVRTTLRLLKHPFLYDDWLGYLTRKIDRSTGEKIELSRYERRFPLVFLWPRVIRYLWHRPQRQP